MTFILPIVYCEVYVKEDADIIAKRIISNYSLLACYGTATLQYSVMSYLKLLNVTLVSFHIEMAYAKKILLNQKLTRNWSREVQRKI